MKNSLNVVLIGVLMVASLLLALPFMPLRSAFSGTTFAYVDDAFYKVGVDLHGKIKNSGLSIKARQYEATLNDFFPSSSGSRLGRSGGRMYGGIVNKKYSSGNYQTRRSGKNEALSGSFLVDENGNPLNGPVKTIDDNGVKFDNSTMQGIDGGSTSRQLAVNATSSGSTARGASAASKAGGVPPGSEPPTPPMGSLPVGSGSFILLLLSAFYSVLKFQLGRN